MAIKSDKWIRRMATEHGMISPFEPNMIREHNNEKIVSYGTSSYGYDIRCAPEFKVFTNINSTIVDLDDPIISVGGSGSAAGAPSSAANKDRGLSVG